MKLGSKVLYKGNIHYTKSITYVVGDQEFVLITEIDTPVNTKELINYDDAKRKHLLELQLIHPEAAQDIQEELRYMGRELM